MNAYETVRGLAGPMMQVILRILAVLHGELQPGINE